MLCSNYCSKRMIQSLCIFFTIAMTFSLLGIPSSSYNANTLFSDVTDRSSFWYKPVYWAADKHITTGYKDGTFKPGNTCTRAQMVTFIWRMAGKPEPKINTNPFSDNKPSDYWYKAALWGNENGIVEGYKDGTFGPQIICARKHAVTFLWRLAGKPEPQNKNCKFSDVKKGDYYYKPVIWAYENKILAGYNDGTFRANGDCLRRQIVTFLWKYNSSKIPIVTPTPIPTDTPSPTPAVYSLKDLSAKEIMNELLSLTKVSTGDMVNDYSKRFPVKPYQQSQRVYWFYGSNFEVRDCLQYIDLYVREEMDGSCTVTDRSYVDVEVLLSTYTVAAELYDDIYNYLYENVKQNSEDYGDTPIYDRREGINWDSQVYDCYVQMNRVTLRGVEYAYKMYIRLPIDKRPLE